jgi:hypothetical protein
MTTLCVCACILSLYSNIFTHHTLYTRTFTSMPLSRYCAHTGSRKTMLMIRPFTFHPYLGITQWFVATGEGGTAGRTGFIFFWVWKSHSVKFCYELAWRREPSLSLFVADRWTGYGFVWAGFLLGTLVIFYSLYILAHMATCLAIVFGTSLMGDVGDGGWGGCLLPVN